MISAQNISKTFNGKKVLDNVSVEVKIGEIISIVGPSGAGKTTLLHVLSTLDKPDPDDKTKLILNEKEIIKLNDDDLSKFRNTQIGFIFQFHELLPEFSAIENVCLPGIIKGDSHFDIIKKAENLLKSLDLIHVKDQKPSELSGGEQQRVAVARALINNPNILFADEPSGNLDSKSADILHNLFFELRDKLNITIVLVTHNKELANMADRKLNLVDGKWTN
ncbi:MAG: ABC transporter ATP-binding protein [Flavobacteriaceae bacterium]|jgi:lipoprotein-releasing system ATP-binding protein|nr:ABC transporter ATP-binding protein [Flavobacteriaceae bacterium]MBT4246560.1 ABC transporter ATP-binding protein [Flavobacteriaceae bacterium]MBT4416061.1 ABC transporter ATP-binding protein [Flavobacteriaceae bacterium]MBT5012110.1 ABC transporter ATP-binding protein [Flavobacteriaceae bacterium]MBT5396096.1 ABC transporter ATP-binding protein [Flavobacteriaceae bacterium]